jgi:hypothetical protein
MKNILLTSLVIFIPAFLYGQTSDTSNDISRMTLTNTAEVFPGTTIGFQAGTSAFTSNSDIYRIRGIVGIGGLVEFDFSNVGAVQTMVYRIQHQASWGIKVKLLSEQDQIPAVAFTMRSAVETQSEWYYLDVLQNFRPDLYQHGIAIARYEYSFSNLQLVVTKRLYSGFLANIGLGATDVQLKNVDFWAQAPNYNYPNILSQDNVKHNFTFQGFVSVLYPVSPKLAILAEAESIPFINANKTATLLLVDRAYHGSLGLRYNLNGAFSLDGTYYEVTNFSGNASTEFRIGLNMFLGIK